MTQAFNLALLANKVNTSGQLDGSTGLTSPVVSNTIGSSASTALTLQSAGTTAVTINTSQYVGIGTTSPTSGLDIRPGITGNFNAITMGYGRSANPTDAVHKISWSSDSLNIEADTANTIASNIIFTNDNTERMRIDSSGSLCIGNSGNFGAKVNITFDPASTNGLLFAVSSGTFTNRYIYFQNSGGSQIGSVSSNNASVTYNTTSDYRIKTNIQPISGALAKVIQLKPVTYDWKPEFAEGSSQGFIAHELAEVVPDCVTGLKDAVDADGKPVYQGIDTSFLVATLTAALQETKTLIDTQAETINALTARIVALEGK